MERQIANITLFITKRGIQPDLLSCDRDEIMVPKDLIDFRAKLDACEEQLRETGDNFQSLKNSQMELIQLQAIIEVFERYVERDEGPTLQTVVDVPAPDATSSSELLGIIPVCFVVDREKIRNLGRMLWRVCNGNVLFRSCNITYPSCEFDDRLQSQTHDACIVFVQGRALKQKVEKIVEAYHGKLYPCPMSSSERVSVLTQLVAKRSDLEEVLQQTSLQLELFMKDVRHRCEQWRINIRKMRSIYHTLNMLSKDVTHKYLVGQCWIPQAKMDSVENELKKLNSTSDSTFVINRVAVPRRLKVPTSFPSNKLTNGFQNIVEAFSIAKYKEINPSLFTVITFPFLFAVMFGDIGHGIIMLCFGAWMCIQEGSLKKSLAASEGLGMIFGGRYVILLMGLFSVYAGLLYNDLFAKSINIFGSSWEPTYKYVFLFIKMNRLLFL